MYRWPANPKSLIEAHWYAEASQNHTFDYEGFKDCHKKYGRILVGKFVQLWLCEFCRLNNVDHIKDASSPRIHDKEDLTICGYSIDCKTSWIDDLWPQVTTVADNSGVDCYFFFRCDESCEFVQPIGAIGRKNFKEHRIEVKRGELLPGTNITQRFEKSYFVDQTHLMSFESAIQALAAHPRQAA